MRMLWAVKFFQMRFLALRLSQEVINMQYTPVAALHARVLVIAFLSLTRSTSARSLRAFVIVATTWRRSGGRIRDRL
jgi:hypothetical protein